MERLLTKWKNKRGLQGCDSMNGTEYSRRTGSYSTAVIGTWQLLSQNISANTSTIRLYLYGYYGGSTSAGSSVSRATFGCMGVTLFTGSYRWYPGYTLLGYTDITVGHNSDGTFPQTRVGFWSYSYHFQPNQETWGYIPEKALPTIARQANITRADNFNSNGKPYMEFTNPGGFKLNLRLEFAGVNISRNNYYGSGGYTFELTDEERNLLLSKCPNGNSLTVRYVVATFIGSNSETHWSYVDRTMTVVDANPIFSDFQFEDVNSKTLALTGNKLNVIKGYSNVKVTIPAINKAVAQKLATMNKYRFNCGDKSTDITYSEDTSVNGTIANVPNGTFNVYAIDSRNNSTLVTKLANKEIEYTPLTKNSIDIARNNGVSENVTLKINGSIDTVDFGLKSNSIKNAQFRYKSTKSGSEWSTYQDLTLNVSNGNFSYDGLVKGDTESLGFDVANSYEVEVLVEDELSSVTFTDKFGSGTPNIALAKNGVGIMGKYDEEEGGLLQVAGKNILKKIKYSTYEVKTNKIWIDEKPIYRKVYNLTVQNENETDINEPDLIPIIDKCIEIRAIANNSVSITEQYYWGGGDTLNAFVSKDRKQIRVRYGANYPIRPFSLIVIIEYTKTTD